MPTNTYLLTKAHSSLALQLSNSLIFIKDDNLTLNLCGSTNDTISVFGHHDTVFLDFGTGKHIDVKDHGAGTQIYCISLPTGLTVEDFQNDHTASLRIGHTSAVPTLTSDHHGGTLATFGVPGTSIDFVGDKHVTATHTPGTITFSA